MFVELVERGVAEIVFHIYKCRKSTEFADAKVVTPNVTWSLTLCNQLGGGFKKNIFIPTWGNDPI